jgi:CubicO group peptidase (beta-lactamase class C family)
MQMQRQLRTGTSRILASLICVTLCFGFQSGAQQANVDPSKAGMNAEKLAQIPMRMKEFVDRGTIAGGVTLVARHGVIAELDAVGSLDLESLKPMRTDSIFQIMSMTKPVTGVALMLLVEEGKVRITDPVEKILPEFRGLSVNEPGGASGEHKRVPPTRPITLRDLLTHTSGMSSGPPAAAADLLQKMNLSLAEAVAIYARQPLGFQPGTRWQYSNPGIATIGRVIEVISGMPYEKFLESRIFRPLGMKDSFIFPPPEKTDRIAMVYNLENGKLKKAGVDLLGGDPALHRKGARYSGPEYAMHSTARDLFVFYQMMLNGGVYNGQRILSRASVDVMTALHTGDIDPSAHDAGVGYGLAWTVVKDARGTLGLQSLGTFGHGGAFGTQGWVDPKKDLVGVFLIGRDTGGGTEEKDAFKAMAAAAIIE